MLKNREADFLPKDFPHAQNIIIDTDAGADDIHALIVAFHLAAKYNKSIVGIVTVEGNTTLSNAIMNILIFKQILLEESPEMKSSFPPIIKGSSLSVCGQPMNQQGDDYFHKDGICSQQARYLAMYPYLRRQAHSEIMENQLHHTDFYNQMSLKYAGNLSVAVLGPMTNLAIAQLTYPTISSRICSLSVMGGQQNLIGRNQSFAADFNFHLDALSAQVQICVADNPLVLFRLLTKKHLGFILLQKYFILQQEKLQGRLLADIYEQIRTFKDPVFCDPIALFPLICPEKSSIKVFNVHGEVQVYGKRTEGSLAIDWLGPKGPIMIISKMDMSFQEQQCILALSSSKNK